MMTINSRKTHIDDMTKRIVIRLSDVEASKLQDFVNNGLARSNADFVRSATLRAFWEIENEDGENIIERSD